MVFNVWNILGIASGLIFLSVVLSMFVKNNRNLFKVFLYLLITVPAILVTAYLIYITISLNVSSYTQGPVHWHADFEIWNCGKKVDLIDPSGVSNRIGTPVLHEHGDERIHVEGVVEELNDASLEVFLNRVGINLTFDELMVPTNGGLIRAKEGEFCGIGPGKIQVFVYKTEGASYYQEKISKPGQYILSPQSSVPPGDCIIIEFDVEKQKTDKLCKSYKVKEQLGDIHER